MSKYSISSCDSDTDDALFADPFARSTRGLTIPSRNDSISSRNYSINTSISNEQQDSEIPTSNPQSDAQEPSSSSHSTSSSSSLFPSIATFIQTFSLPSVPSLSHLAFHKYCRVPYPVRLCPPDEGDGLSLSQGAVDAMKRGERGWDEVSIAGAKRRLERRDSKTIAPPS